jgi:hypothetical protein
MRPSWSISSLFLFLLFAGSLVMGLVSCPGCGGLPETGTDATSVNPEVATQQNKAMQEYYASKGKGPLAKKAAASKK